MVCGQKTRNLFFFAQPMPLLFRAGNRQVKVPGIGLHGWATKSFAVAGLRLWNCLYRSNFDSETWATENPREFRRLLKTDCFADTRRIASLLTYLLFPVASLHLHTIRLRSAVSTSFAPNFISVHVPTIKEYDSQSQVEGTASCQSSTECIV